MDAAQKRAMHIVRGFVPNLPIPGMPTWGGQSILRALKGEEDFMGNRHDLLERRCCGLSGSR